MTSPLQQALALLPGGREFGPQQALRTTRELLRQLEPADVVGGNKRDQQMAAAALSGLWLRHGFLDESHSFSQSLETAEGSYWHGIMHRREPDYGNAKYWFRRVGKHPVCVELAAQLNSAIAAGEVATGNLSPAAAHQISALAGEWDPFAFVDLCQQAACGDQSLRTACEVIADLEWQALFDYCRSQAGATSAKT